MEKSTGIAIAIVIVILIALWYLSTSSSSKETVETVETTSPSQSESKSSTIADESIPETPRTLLQQTDPIYVDQSGTGFPDIPILLYPEANYQGLPKRLFFSQQIALMTQSRITGLDGTEFKYKSMKINPGTIFKIFSKYAGKTNAMEMVADRNIPNIQEWLDNLSEDYTGDKGMFYGVRYRDNSFDVDMTFFLTSTGVSPTYNQLVPKLVMFKDVNRQGLGYPVFAGDAVTFMNQTRYKKENWHFQSISLDPPMNVQLQHVSSSKRIPFETEVTIHEEVNNIETDLIDMLPEEKVKAIFYGKLNKTNWAHQSPYYRIFVPLTEPIPQLPSKIPAGVPVVTLSTSFAFASPLSTKSFGISF